jgi:Lon-like ATP-dependent protease
MAVGSVENVITVLRRRLDKDPRDFDIHVNFPGGVPVDGPSAGAAMAVAIYSAITGTPIDNEVAITGEMSVRGAIKPVGGIVAKVAAARQAGATKVVIPKENWQEMFKQQKDFEVIPITTIEELLVVSLIKPQARAVASDATGS